MELIVAVYDDWGIGKDGTQPIALTADRKFFRETTRGAMVIVGRKTLADFPGGKPLPNRVNVVLTRQQTEIPDVVVCNSTEEAAELAKTAQRAMVIGGGTIYKQMLPYCDTAYITKVHTTTGCDTWFPNLDEDSTWKLTETGETFAQDDFTYTFTTYEKVG